MRDGENEVQLRLSLKPDGQLGGTLGFEQKKQDRKEA
jgi:hypothetical protein